MKVKQLYVVQLNIRKKKHMLATGWTTTGKATQFTTETRFDLYTLVCGF